MGTSKKYGMNTKAIHTEKRVKLPTGDVMPPIHLSTTFENTQPGEYEYFYGRSGNRSDCNSKNNSENTECKNVQWAKAKG